ncbi:Hypothetical predicted protein, partial [Mytilus galloprovincialis]
MRTKTGFRVVRGPDWNNQRQDNGEGFLGTIVYVPKEGSDDQKVTVIWDSGRELRYRAGLHGKYDLRVFDSAPAGVTHTGVICDSCKEKDIRGARWKCCDCGQYNMCSTCYMTDKHDIHHSFERIDSPQSSAVNVPPRADSKFSRRTARGLFPNVQVMRGPHWKWKNDDGGESGIGAIKEICTWGTNGYRGGVKVVWKSDRSVKNYRVGAEGCIDVICVDKTDTNTGGNYYCDHLPVVNVVDPEKIALKIGDKVIVNLPLKNFMEMQKDPIYGGWDEGLGQCLKEMGTITSFLYGGKSARLQYEDSRTWLVNRMALFRKHTFSLGDPVKIHKDYKVVKELQKGHGGWNDEMKHALGKNGHIVRLDNEGDMMVQIENKKWIFNPTCITPIEGDRLSRQALAACTDNDNDDSDDTDDSDDDYTEVSENLADFFYDLLQEEQTSADVNVSLIDAASKGDLETIRRLVNRYPNKINLDWETSFSTYINPFPLCGVSLTCKRYASHGRESNQEPLYGFIELSWFYSVIHVHYSPLLMMSFFTLFWINTLDTTGFSNENILHHTYRTQLPYECVGPNLFVDVAISFLYTYNLFLIVKMLYICFNFIYVWTFNDIN